PTGSPTTASRCRRSSSDGTGWRYDPTVGAPVGGGVGDGTGRRLPAGGRPGVRRTVGLRGRVAAGTRVARVLPARTRPRAGAADRPGQRHRLRRRRPADCDGGGRG